MDLSVAVDTYQLCQVEFMNFYSTFNKHNENWAESKP